VIRLSSKRPDLAIAGQDARELRDYILDHIPADPPEVNVVRTDPTAMDAGAVVEIVIALAAHSTVVGIVEGVKAWIEHRKIPVLVEIGGEVRAIDHVSPRVLQKLQQEILAAAAGNDLEA